MEIFEKLVPCTIEDTHTPMLRSEMDAQGKTEQGYTKGIQHLQFK